MSHYEPKPIDAKELTDNEHQCLMALVAEYGPAHIVELIADMAEQIEEDRDDAEYIQINHVERGNDKP